MSYLSITVECSGSSTFSTTLGQPVFRLPIRLKRKISNALSKEAHSVDRIAQAHEQIEWEQEAQAMQRQQDADLSEPVMAWWQPAYNEDEWIEMMADTERVRRCL